MSKNSKVYERSYEDLSRRALIKLGHDFDEDNKNSLQTYLTQMELQGCKYENIRTCEVVIDKADHISESVRKNAKAIKNACAAAVVNTLDGAIDHIAKLIEAGK